MVLEPKKFKREGSRNEKYLYVYYIFSKEQKRSLENCDYAFFLSCCTLQEGSFLHLEKLKAYYGL